MRNKPREIKNFLPKKDHKYIQDLLKDSGSFPWFLNKAHGTSDASYVKDQSLKYKRIKEGALFYHTFYDNNIKEKPINSCYMNIVEMLCKCFLKKQKIKELNLWRSKANLQLQVQDFNKEEYNTPHVDYDIPHYVLLYYVNETDGDTFLFNNDYSIIKIIKPEANKLLFFDGSIPHAGSHPSRHAYRIVININFTYEK